ncbi:MAG: SurA N-terminal domain-containing protein [Prevotella sp.]|jgi:peptidyl-prolyl cis-trans isomerase D|nr:SurA N-terminal domain-containing protein [Prevotella sp.]
MAALQKIRSKSGLLIGIIAVGLLAFVFPWSELSSFINKSKDKAFTVNGEVITTKQYADRIAQWEHFQKVMSGQNSLDEAASSQIREMVYQQMVKEIMLDEQADKLGLSVTSEELNDMVVGANVAPVLFQIPFFINPQTGQFDKAYLNQFIQSISQDEAGLSENQKAEIQARREIWAFIQNMIKYQRLEEKYSSLVAGSVLPSATEVKSSFEDSKVQANISYVVQRYSAIPDSAVDVSDKDVKALYDKRKNNFKLDSELRKISYFVKDVVPSDEDYAAVEKEINGVYEKFVTTDNPGLLVNEYSSNQFADAFVAVASLPSDMKSFVQTASIGEVKQPERTEQSYVMYKLMDRTTAADSVKLQLIPFQGLDQATATHIADSLMTVMKGGKDFTTLANELMPGSNGGEIGWATEMSLIGTGADVVKKCFTAAKGDVFTLTINGQTQLIRVQDKTNPVSKVKIAVIQMPVIISDKTQNSIDNELNQFVAENGNMENFDNVALTKGYNIISNAVISPSEMSLGQVSGTRQVISWAFNNKVGTVKKFDNLTNKRVVAIIKNSIEGDYMPVSEVSPMLKAELINEKKAEKMIADLKSKNLTSLQAYAEAVTGRVDTVSFVTFQTNNISGVGYEPILNVYAKHGQVNKLEQPMKGKAGVYVLDVTSKTDNTNTFDEAQAKQMIRQGNFYQLMSQAVFVLQEKMNVKDNRVTFW